MCVSQLPYSHARHYSYHGGPMMVSYGACLYSSAMLGVVCVPAGVARVYRGAAHRSVYVDS